MTKRGAMSDLVEREKGNELCKIKEALDWGKAFDSTDLDAVKVKQ